MKILLKNLRLLALLMMIALASILPVPITFYRKDNLPKFKIELVDRKDDETKQEDVKSIQ